MFQSGRFVTVGHEKKERFRIGLQFQFTSQNRFCSFLGLRKREKEAPRKKKRRSVPQPSCMSVSRICGDSCLGVITV